MDSILFFSFLLIFSLNVLYFFFGFRGHIFITTSFIMFSALIFFFSLSFIFTIYTSFSFPLQVSFAMNSLLFSDFLHIYKYFFSLVSFASNTYTFHLCYSSFLLISNEIFIFLCLTFYYPSLLSLYFFFFAFCFFSFTSLPSRLSFSTSLPFSRLPRRPSQGACVPVFIFTSAFPLTTSNSSPRVPFPTCL